MGRLLSVLMFPVSCLILLWVAGSGKSSPRQSSVPSFIQQTFGLFPHQAPRIIREQHKDWRRLHDSGRGQLMTDASNIKEILKILRGFPDSSAGK